MALFASIDAKRVAHRIREMTPLSHGEQERLRYWRRCYNEGTLTPEDLTPDQRIQLQDWIATHPNPKR